MYVANEGKLVAFVRRGGRGRSAGRAALGAGLRAGGGDRRGADRAARDGAGGDELWRQAGHGPAGRRPAAADLLSEEGVPMATTDVFAEQKETEAVTAHVLWMTTGLSCEGDSVAMTSATNPSLEDIITQAIPGMPKVVVHNQVIAYEVGRRVHPGLVRRRGGQARPVRARDRGLARQREDQRRGALDRLRGEPVERAADHDQRVARPARAEGGRGGGRRDLRHLRRHPGDEEQPDRCHGRAGLPGLELEVHGRTCRSSASRAARPSRTT